jgi:hypothetical protein
MSMLMSNLMIKFVLVRICITAARSYCGALDFTYGCEFRSRLWKYVKVRAIRCYWENSVWESECNSLLVEKKVC